MGMSDSLVLDLPDLLFLFELYLIFLVVGVLDNPVSLIQLLLFLLLLMVDFEVGYLLDDTLLLLLTGFFFLCLRLASFVAVHVSTSETRYFTSFEINIVNNLIKNKRFDTRYIDIRCYRHR